MSGGAREDEGDLRGGAWTSTCCRRSPGKRSTSSCIASCSMAPESCVLARFVGLEGRVWMLGSRSRSGRRAARFASYKQSENCNFIPHKYEICNFIPQVAILYPTPNFQGVPRRTHYRQEGISLRTQPEVNRLNSLSRFLVCRCRCRCRTGCCTGCRTGSQCHYRNASMAMSFCRNIIESECHWRQ